MDVMFWFYAIFASLWFYLAWIVASIVVAITLGRVTRLRDRTGRDEEDQPAPAPSTSSAADDTTPGAALFVPEPKSSPENGLPAHAGYLYSRTPRQHP